MRSAGTIFVSADTSIELFLPNYYYKYEKDRELSSKHKVNYQFNDNGEFIITNYNSAKLFSSFFPGIAGKNGFPMWTFYVNRGQCICSMGTEGKHHPIMEFLPANWAYNLVTSQGFRTFVKFPDKAADKFYEPFQNNAHDDNIRRTQRMVIKPAKLILEEENQTLGLKFTVEYFNVPQESYSGLVRKLSVQNLNSNSVKIQVLDGLPLIIPYGLEDYGLKHLRRLFEAFVEVINFENNVPFFKLKVEPADRPDVVLIKKGNFYLGFGPDSLLVKPIYDPVKIFGISGNYNYPEEFVNNQIEELITGQIFENRLPCAMGLFEATIASNNSYTYTSVIGHANSVSDLNKLVPDIVNNDYIEKKSIENQEIITILTQKNFICSSQPALDRYARQNFLDNVMRGGFPYTIKGNDTSTILHLFSRKHGDLERDYNDFRLTPTHYSQGNGNYRDVNQNRRSDLFFNPDVQESNVIQFYNMIQLDGFNPLVIKEIRFRINQSLKEHEILSEYFEPGSIKMIKDFLEIPYTPGELMVYLKEQAIEVKGDADNFVSELLGISEKEYVNEHGEGYWIDHWIYNLDLLENYLAIYPEKEEYILFKKKTFSFFDNPHCVQPRHERYAIWEGKAMQLDSVVLDKEKEQLINQRNCDPNRVRAEFGKGDVYNTTLFNILLSLIINKLSSLDSEGVGVEMEAGKPGWYDALNGLPGLIGSSICETLEIKRHILFLLDAVNKLGDKNQYLSVFVEMLEFMNKLHYLLKVQISDYEFWDKTATAKENYRAKTRLGISGREDNISVRDVVDFFENALKKLDIGISKAWNKKENIISTYFINEVTEYAIIKETGFDDKEIPKCNEKGLSLYQANKFRQTSLPLFLEGPVHYLRCSAGSEEAIKLAERIRESGLFDDKLNMYKVNESLCNQSMEIGRARTFSPGWFENESVWLHMEYKYMLELIRKELFNEFYKDFKNVFVPFFKPEIYGRSILENSSFIVSSANPDPSIHGNGFVARLSGATAEFINILLLMIVGEKPFTLNPEGKLQLQFKPALPGWMFTVNIQKSRLLIDDIWRDVEFAENTFSFMFLGEILVTYHNKNRQDTFGPNGVSPVGWKIFDSEGIAYDIRETFLTGEIAEKIRSRIVRRIEIELN